MPRTQSSTPWRSDDRNPSTVSARQQLAALLLVGQSSHAASVTAPGVMRQRRPRTVAEGALAVLALRADGILDRRYRVYRASGVALYSRFLVVSTPDLTTDKRLGRSTDNPRESG
jgi:hypothetical protein